ncbi:hypothetical protein PVK62_01095 [Aliivibrio sp. S3MY1]|uniref:hypothetical protein n=1 Tax=unclassified Aliivibrio TaxID=2645654 RepID=UPI002378A1EE|nr:MULTISPECIES: hypothetical protein [unclassified Aliivibrio]MDD9194427.1 hypothetical protein [Aliivibrio sp. S3MY1]MDD9198234.1 hypothetical protein [Aliivibrio sp. S2MY1]
MNYLKQFLSGFLSTLIFHQGIVAIGYVLGIFPNVPYNIASTEPFGIPSIVSISLFGGGWGVIIWYFIKKFKGTTLWVLSFVLSGFLLTMFFSIIIAPFKGIDINIARFLTGFILNGFWGIGNTLFVRLFKSNN